MIREQLARLWHIALVPELKRQKQVDLCEFKTRLVYGVSSGTAKAAQHSETLSWNTHTHMDTYTYKLMCAHTHTHIQRARESFLRITVKDKQNDLKSQSW